MEPTQCCSGGVVVQCAFGDVHSCCDILDDNLEITRKAVRQHQISIENRRTVETFHQNPTKAIRTRRQGMLVRGVHLLHENAPVQKSATAQAALYVRV